MGSSLAFGLVGRSIFTFSKDKREERKERRLNLDRFFFQVSYRSGLDELRANSSWKKGGRRRKGAKMSGSREEEREKRFHPLPPSLPLSLLAVISFAEKKKKKRREKKMLHTRYPEARRGSNNTDKAATAAISFFLLPIPLPKLRRGKKSS